MDKTVSMSDTKFLQKNGPVTLELTEGQDNSIMIVSLKNGKEHLTSSLSKADLYLLLEFLKNRGIV